MKKEEEEGVGKKVDIAPLFKHAFLYRRMVRTAKRGENFFLHVLCSRRALGEGSPGKSRFRSTVFNHPPLEGCTYVVCTYVQ